MKKKSLSSLALRALQLLVSAAVVAVILAAIMNIKSTQGQQGREQLELAVRRSAMACYAVEGVYPPSLEYLEERYGLQVDRENYLVSYSAFAENLMPDITVLEKGV